MLEQESADCLKFDTTLLKIRVKIQTQCIVYQAFIAGPKTVFFWAPSVKWVLVIAGLGDLKRPPEKMSLFQSSALAVTGTIWARYSLVIIPVNYYLFTVNVFVALTGFYQLNKIYRYRRQLSSQQSVDQAQ